MAATSLGFEGNTNSNMEVKHIRTKHIWKKKIQYILGRRVHCWLQQHGDLDAGSGSPKWLKEENRVSQRKTCFLFH